MTKLKKIIRWVLLLAILAGAAYTVHQFYLKPSAQSTHNAFKTAEVNIANIRRTISATGTVEPEELINVGAQVNGKIMSFGKDTEGKTVDYGSRVTEGMVLAQIDDVTYKAELQEAEASLQQSEAAILSAEAAIQEAEANDRLAQSNWDRAQTLYEQKSMTRSDYDSYQASLLSSKAATAKAKAQLAQAKASRSIAEASLAKARRNLEYCTIISPVNGVVIDRRVSIGQTVVSNQTASSIFLVARDFKKMQVWVSVNEADIGNIRPGMGVIFSCDAYPNVEFHGVVHRIRLNATLSSNVVTYIVEVNADNADGKLVPYLTANVKFIRAERLNVLAAPNAALRYTPTPDLYQEMPPELEAGEGIVWIRDAGEKLVPVKVKLGLTNNILTEITTDEIKPGDEVVTGVEKVFVVNNGANEERNPFMPNMPKPPARGSAGARERAAAREKANAASAPSAGAGAKPATAPGK